MRTRRSRLVLGSCPLILSVLLILSALPIFALPASDGARAQAAQTPPGMTEYYVGLLQRGPKWTAARTPETQAVQAGHMTHMNQLAADGLLVGAGPVAGDGNLRGVLILAGGSPDALRQRVEQDPAVRAGRLVLSLHKWLGPKDVGQAYVNEHKANPNAKDEMLLYQLAVLSKTAQWVPATTPELQDLQKRHLAHIANLEAKGTLVAAGPFLDNNDEIRGIVVFAPGISESGGRAALSADPAVQAGRLLLTFHAWYVARGVLPEKPKQP